MITQINNSSDCRKAINENIYGLLTGKRKPLIVKEMNNSIGKLLTDVKLEAFTRFHSGDKNLISWFNDIKQIENNDDFEKESYKKLANRKAIK